VESKTAKSAIGGYCLHPKGGEQLWNIIGIITQIILDNYCFIYNFLANHRKK